MRAGRRKPVGLVLEELARDFGFVGDGWLDLTLAEFAAGREGFRRAWREVGP